MELTITTYDLNLLMQKSAALGATIALQSIGKIKPVLSKQEAYKLSNRAAVDRALSKGALKTVKKGGSTSNVYILRESFNVWVTKDELESLPLSFNK